jgi:hypothetical protein
MGENSTHPDFKERFKKILQTKTIQRFIFVMSIRHNDDNLYDLIKRYIKSKWTELISRNEVL